MKATYLVGPLLVLAIIVATAASDSTQRERIHVLATEVLSATKSGNYKRVMDLTYPKVVEMMGGRDKAVQMIEQAMQAVKVLEAQSDDPGEIVSSGDKQFCVVPTRMRLQVGNKTVRTKGFLLAVSEDAGKHWTFLDGEGLYQGGANPKEKAKTYGLELPDDLALPEHEKPVVDSE